MLMRDYVDSCTGNLLLGTLDEDYRTYCKGWLPLISENCTRMAEYEFRYSSFNVKPQDFLNIVIVTGLKLSARRILTKATSERTAVADMS